MPMDRFQLSQIIDAGRSSALNCLEIGNAIPADDPTGKMFRNEALNRSIFFKVMEQITSLHHTISIVQTLIYFPYNLDNVYEGGDSILFDDPSFHRLMQVKMDIDTKSRQGQIDYVMDLELIEMIHSLPSLDPFLFKSKAEQLDLLDRIHPSYFNISEQEWERIRRPIREKILVLVQSAFKNQIGEEISDKQMNVLTERFLNKIWEARDVKGIEPFINAMSIKPEKAPDIFFAWKAVCFYQAEFERRLPVIRDLLVWLNDNSLAQPIDAGRMVRSERQRLEAERDKVRERARYSLQKIISTLHQYEDSYKHFVENGEPYLFKEFLASADDHYQEIAACLSAATHATKAWGEAIEKYGEHLNQAKYTALMRTLAILFDAKIHNPELRAAG